MDIMVVGADGLPDKAYLSIRAGELRKQAQYKPGVVFDMKAAPKHFVLDVFEKVSSKQVSLCDLQSPIGDAEAGQRVLKLSGRGGSPISLDVQVKFSDPAEDDGQRRSPKRVRRHQAALQAKGYLDSCGVQKMLQSMVHELLTEQPSDALGFMTSYLEKLALKRAAAREKTASEVAPPLAEGGAAPGDDAAEELEDGFPTDGSACLPDLSRHHSVLATVLKSDPAVYSGLRAVRSAAGVTLARCIKPGVDNRGHPVVRSVGIVAGDASCFDVFRDVFDPIIRKLHPGFSPDSRHATELEASKVSDLPLDASGSRVVSVQLQGSRSLSGGFRMPTAASLEELCEAELLLSGALGSLGGRLEGAYHPLRGMRADVQDDLRASGVLFEEPDSAIMLSAGYGRCWPHGRGVFVGKEKDFFVWVNEMDHLKIFSRQPGGDLKQAFERFGCVVQSVGASLKASGSDYACDGRLGFLNSCPSNIGTALHVSATLRIPLLGSRGKEFRARCKGLRLQARARQSGAGGVAGLGGEQSGLWELSSHSRLGCSEAGQVNSLIHGCRELTALEARLEAGENPSEVLGEGSSEPAPVPARGACPAADSCADGLPGLPAPQTAAKVGKGDGDDDNEEEAGLGELEFPGFPADTCPEEIPSLDRHHSLMATVLKGDPSIYPRLRGLRTAMDVSLARCIKTGMDNRGHPMISTVGLVAGDAECYDLFAPVFEPVIRERHAGFDPARDRHASGLDASLVVASGLDPVGGYVQKVQVWVDRNLRSLRFPPAASKQERIEAEKAITAALLKVPGLGGEYHPLPGSRSYVALPFDMSEETEKRLTQKGLMMRAPDSHIVLSAGTGRHWPKARGVFTAEECQTVAFVNHEAHLRLRCSRDGTDLRGAFARLCEVERGVREALRADSHQFAESDRLGQLVTSPGDLGTAMHAEVFVRLQLLSTRPQFKKLCQRCMVTARATVEGGAGLVCVWNSQTLGSTEAGQVNAVIRAVRHFVSLEAQLMRGLEVDMEAPLPELEPVSSHQVEDVR